MRALHGRILAAVPPKLRGQADNWVADLLDLATDNLSPAARAEVIHQALAGSQAKPDTERDWEVAHGIRTVTASSPHQAASLARQEWLKETEDRYYQPDPNDAYEVRPAHSRGPWQTVYPDQPPARKQPHQPGLEDAVLALHSRILAAVPPAQRDHAGGWMADLLDLATDNLSPAARAEVIHQALAGSQAKPDTERDWEVAHGIRTVAASSPHQAASLARQEWSEETGHPCHQPDPNDAYEVRPAHSRGPWQTVYPDQPPARKQPHQPGLELE